MCATVLSFDLFLVSSRDSFCDMEIKWFSQAHILLLLHHLKLCRQHSLCSYSTITFPKAKYSFSHIPSEIDNAPISQWTSGECKEHSPQQTFSLFLKGPPFSALERQTSTLTRNSWEIHSSLSPCFSAQSQLVSCGAWDRNQYLTQVTHHPPPL